MKKILLMIFIFCATLGFAQVHSVDVFAEYSSPVKKINGIDDLSGVGAGAKIRFPVYENFSVNVYGAYTLYSLSQENALAGWGWEFWTRYNDFVRQTLSDEAYSNFMNPVQKMDLLQLYLTVDYDFKPIEKLHVKPAIGGGLYFYTRRLYIDETWTKYFTSIDYTFEYEFRNIAPQKAGNLLFIMGGLDINYELTESFWISGSAKYINVFASKYSYAYDKFIFKNALNLNLGLTILY